MQAIPGLGLFNATPEQFVELWSPPFADVSSFEFKQAYTVGRDVYAYLYTLEVAGQQRPFFVGMTRGTDSEAETDLFYFNPLVPGVSLLGSLKGEFTDWGALLAARRMPESVKGYAKLHIERELSAPGFDLYFQLDSLKKPVQILHGESGLNPAQLPDWAKANAVVKAYADAMKTITELNGVSAPLGPEQLKTLRTGLAPETVSLFTDEYFQNADNYASYWPLLINELMHTRVHHVIEAGPVWYVVGTNNDGEQHFVHEMTKIEDTFYLSSFRDLVENADFYRGFSMNSLDILPCIFYSEEFKEQIIHR